MKSEGEHNFCHQSFSLMSTVLLPQKNLNTGVTFTLTLLGLSLHIHKLKKSSTNKTDQRIIWLTTCMSR